MSAKTVREKRQSAKQNFNSEQGKPWDLILALILERKKKQKMDGIEKQIAENNKNMATLIELQKQAIKEQQQTNELLGKLGKER